jgi:hypothetical protein
MAKTTNLDVQVRAIKQVSDYYETSSKRMEKFKQRRLEIYKEYESITEKRQSNWSSSFKINKMREVVEKVLPRIIAKNPRWIVTPSEVDYFPDTPEILELRAQIVDGISNEQREEIEGEIRTVKQEKTTEWARAVQDYLTYIWEEYNQIEPVRRAAKSMIKFGKTYMKVKYKYERSFLSEVDAEGGQVLAEEVTGEYPTVEVKSWTDVYYDPRFIDLRDRPAFVEVSRGVRFSDLWRKKGAYMNLDKVEKLGNLGSDLSDDSYHEAVAAIAGVSVGGVDNKVDLGSLDLKTYYGYFSTAKHGDPKFEKIYKIVTVDDLVVIQMDQISRIPFVEIKCFEDTETADAYGFLDTIVGMQKEYNFKKNAAAEYINKHLTRQVVWSSQSGIDPRTMNDPVIVTSKSVNEALANFQELQRPQIPSSYFQESNDFERQFQAATHTVDTSNPRGQQALTNTATGARIKFFESNSVMEEVRQHFEKGLEEVAYLMLQSAFENMEDNIVFKKTGTEEFWNVNKEFLRNAIMRYSIRVEANSSSFDSIESKREDAIAWYNILSQAKSQGLNVNLEEGLRDTANSFEKKDIGKYLSVPDVQEQLQKLGLAQQGAGGKIAQPEKLQSESAETTQAVAGGEQLFANQR